jgi:type II secretory pathway component PulF
MEFPLMTRSLLAFADWMGRGWPLAVVLLALGAVSHALLSYFLRTRAPKLVPHAYRAAVSLLVILTFALSLLAIRIPLDAVMTGAR